MITQTAFAVLFGFAIGQRNPGRGSHPDDRGHVFGTRPALIFVGAAEHDWLDRQPAAEKKKSGAFRSVKFVRGEAGRINQ